ncbi:hypothetical protein YC2023_036853 [Brassica napus]
MLNHHPAAPCPPVGVVPFFALQICHPRLLLYFNAIVLHLCQSSFLSRNKNFKLPQHINFVL